MEPPNGSGGGKNETSGQENEAEMHTLHGVHGVARGRGGGWKGTIKHALTEVDKSKGQSKQVNNDDEVTEQESDEVGIMTREQEKGAATKIPSDTGEKEKAPSILGNEGSRRAAEEYKETVKNIMTWEIIVEKTKENMEKAVNEEEKQRLGERLISEKRLLNQFRQEERNHFLSGSFTDMEIWGDMSDEEEEDDEDNIEILSVTPNTVRRMDEMKTRMNNRDSYLEGFTDSDDEEMEEPVPEPAQGGKRKTRDDIVLEGEKHEEDKSDWKLVINKKKSAKEIKNNQDSGDNLKRYNTNSAENQRVSGKVANHTLIKQQGENYYAERSKGGITAKRDDKKLVKVMQEGEKNVRIIEDDKKSGNTKKVLIADAIKPGNESRQAVPEIRSSLQRTITSYASATKVVHNSNQIRFNFSFNVRVNNPSEWRRVAKILLEQSYEIDRKSCILPWDESKVDNGQGITLDMVTNKLTMRDSMIAKYFNAKGNMIPGKVYYQAGVRFSTELETSKFLDQWNSNKRDRKERGLEVVNLGLANMQNSVESFLIGIAVGSSEDQDTTILNKTLEKETGIPGIEVSYQNFYQAGITNEFWDIANKKAKATGANDTSRDYLRCKYSWAPSALAVFVPKIHMVAQARKTMIQKYGKLIEGANPQWPDGTRMRFLPIKGGTLKSDKTRAIIKKRVAYHIWIKAHERIVTTNLVNIHQGQELFEGKSLSQMLLQIDSVNTQHMGLFRHFKRMWSTGRDKEDRWAISVHKGLYEEACVKLQGLQQELLNKFGDKVNHFFANQPFRTFGREQSTSTGDDDEENWFDDEDSIPEKAVIEQGFEKFLDDDQSEISWGTNLTKYTELVQPSTQSTNTSSITHEVMQVDAEELERRQSAVEHYLVTQYKMDQESLQKVKNHEAPYRIVTRAIKEKVWEIDEVLEGINAIYQAQKVPKAPDPRYDDDDDL